MVPKSHQYGLKIFCAFTTFLLFIGILLSLSRGAWISTLLGIAIFVWLAPWGVERQRAKRKGRGRERQQNLTPNTQHPRPYRFVRVARLSAITVCILLIVSLFFSGESGREQVDARLEETFERDVGLADRMTAWKDSLSMIRDFPLLGVGLGAWQDVYNHYESGQWSSQYFKKAHHDYVEILAEAGIIGFILLGCFFVGIGRGLISGAKKLSTKSLPLVAGVLAAAGSMAIHSFIDFSLQIPANALLFTVLLALGLRLTGSREHGARSSEQSEWSPVSGLPSAAAINLAQSAWSAEPHAPRSSRPTPYAVSALALLLIGFAVTQEEEPRRPQSIAEARERLLWRPVKASYHLSVIGRVGDEAPPEWQLREYQAALWIQPTNPYIRDKVAETLNALGRTEEVLQEMTKSVAHAPSLRMHEYLSKESLPELSEEQQRAVEAGFKQAAAWNYPEAVTGLAEFYTGLERYADVAGLYEQAAAKEMDKQKKLKLLIEGGRAYLRADRAERESSVRGEGLGVRGNGSEQRAGIKTVRSKVSGVSGQTNSATNADNAKNAINSKNAERNNAINATNSTNAPHASRLTPNPLPLRPHAAAAERLFREATGVDPTDSKPYDYLLTRIFAEREDLESAKELVAEGIRRGAPALPLYISLAETAHKVKDQDVRETALKSAKAEVDNRIKGGESPYPLYIALADGARRAGDRDQESAALLKALDRQPRSPETLMRLANVYIEKRNYDRATMYLNRVAAISPNSADLYYHIAQTEEARYHFAAAGRAYARALELAPQNDDYRQRYEAFRLRLQQNRTPDASFIVE